MAPGIVHALDGMAVTINGAPVVSIPVAHVEARSLDGCGRPGGRARGCS